MKNLIFPVSAEKCSNTSQSRAGFASVFPVSTISSGVTERIRFCQALSVQSVTYGFWFFCPYKRIVFLSLNSQRNDRMHKCEKKALRYITEILVCLQTDNSVI